MQRSAANFVTRYGSWAAVAGASEGLGAEYADALDYLNRLAQLDSNLKRLSESIGAQTGDLDDFFGDCRLPSAS